MKWVATSLFAGALLLGGCATPGKTPGQQLAEARGFYTVSVKTFAAYSEQPFCDLPSAPKPPFCADRDAVIRGAKLFNEAGNALEMAESAARAAGVTDTDMVAKAVALTRSLQGFMAGVGK